MKIAVFADSYKPQINGMVTSIDLYTKSLRKKGHVVRIFAPSSPNYHEKDKQVERIRSVKFKSYKKNKKKI